VLNSVAQYFPNADYLSAVLRRAVEMAPPGGAIFVGDLHGAELLPTFRAVSQLSQSAEDAELDALHKRIRHAAETDKELAVDPGFFFALQKELPRIAQVKILLKRRGADNELTRYRYDAVLRIDAPAAAAAECALERPAGSSLDELESLLATARLTGLFVRGVRNARLARDVALAAAIQTKPRNTTVGALRWAVAELERGGADPADYWDLGERTGYEVVAAWTPNAGDGRFDVAFVDPARLDAGLLRLGSPDPLGACVAYANDPQSAQARHEMARRVRARLRAALPDYMIPPDLAPIDRMPLMPNGKIDRKALPARGVRSDEAEYEPPSGPAEIALASVWSNVLGVEQVGRGDDFFELGGHSLLVMRMAALVRDELGVQLAMRAVFEAPTLRQLAGMIEAEQKRSSLVDQTLRRAGRPPALAPVLLQAGSSDPLYLAHAMGGDGVSRPGAGAGRGIRTTAASGLDGACGPAGADLRPWRPLLAAAPAPRQHPCGADET
jgi:acyl carrier protein